MITAQYYTIILLMTCFRRTDSSLSDLVLNANYESSDTDFEKSCGDEPGNVSQKKVVHYFHLFSLCLVVLSTLPSPVMFALTGFKNTVRLKN